MTAVREEDGVFTIEPTSEHTATVIFLHGLGDNGESWKEILEEFREPHIKYVCPTASAKPVSVNRGSRMPSWFDVFGFDEECQQDEKSVTEAAELLQMYIAKEEATGMKRDRIMIGGISQGGATVLYSAFTIEQQPLAGIFVFSTWLPLHKEFPAKVKANRETPIFQGHGQRDNLVKYEFGCMAADIIRSFNSNLEFKMYPALAHWVCKQELMEMQEFIRRCLPPTGPATAAST